MKRKQLIFFPATATYAKLSAVLEGTYLPESCLPASLFLAQQLMKHQQ